MEDRLAVRQRPDGFPLVHQTWETLLFLHWRVPAAALRPHVPARLAIDTFNGSAWIALTPFMVTRSRPMLLPPIPFVSDFGEINVRTYVHLDGVPGVWFFSLDADSALAVAAARAFFALPYHQASITLERRESAVSYSATRRGPGPLARFEATWAIGAALPEAKPGSLEFFLVERYCLYAARDGKLFRSRIHHAQGTEAADHESSLVEADGLPSPDGDPIFHCAGPVDVGIWGLKEV
jgi:uncharacterized protein